MGNVGLWVVLGCLGFQVAAFVGSVSLGLQSFGTAGFQGFGVAGLSYTLNQALVTLSLSEGLPNPETPMN